VNINPDILNDINADVRSMLALAAEAHVETDRRATVTLKLTIARDKEGKHNVKARVSAVIPEGVDDSHTRKGDTALLLSVSDEIPGQRHIGDEA
jgi:hypothetical protein